MDRFVQNDKESRAIAKLSSANWRSSGLRCHLKSSWVECFNRFSCTEFGSEASLEILCRSIQDGHLMIVWNKLARYTSFGRFFCVVLIILVRISIDRKFYRRYQISLGSQRWLISGSHDGGAHTFSRVIGQYAHYIEQCTLLHLTLSFGTNCMLISFHYVSV